MGGAGNNTASYANATAGVTVDLDLWGQAQNTGGDGIDTLLGFNNLIGSKFNDTLQSTGGYFGFLSGGAGDDRLTASYSDNVALNGEDGNDTLVGFTSMGTTLNGGAGDDRLTAGDGDFTLNGGAGNDWLQAGNGDFTLNGGDGNDVLSVDSALLGDSTLNGGVGADTLVDSYLVNDGSPANAGVILTFDYNSVSESAAGAGKDTIIGFDGRSYQDDSDLGGDRIALTTIDANTLVSGNQAFTYIGGAAFTAAGQLRYTGGILQGSTDADAAAEFEIQLVGSPTLSVGGAGTDILL